MLPWHHVVPPEQSSQVSKTWLLFLSYETYTASNLPIRQNPSRLTTWLVFCIMAQNRKQQIIDSASRLIAQKGFEGLRTREIAEQVGINHATVHYHFADKEKLIEAVLQSVTEKIYQSDIEAPVSKNASATEKLATIFRNNLLQRQQYPERFTVLRELGMRANRDPRIERILSRLDEDLYAKMRAVLDSGVQSRDFRADLDTEQMAVMLITLLRGVKFQLDQEDINRYMRVYHQIEQDMLI